MENTHEFKTVHDPLFCKEEDIAFILNTEKEYQSTENKFYNPGDIPSCNPDNSCEVIQDFLGEQTSIHYSLWYYEFKEEKTKRILEIEKRLFELKNEHLDLIQEFHNIQDDLLVRLNKTLK